ncbi:MAG: hypothetical protein ACXVFU_16550 [Nocardioidaceae bacterium]
MTTRPSKPGEHHGLVASTVDVFLDRTRALAELMASAASGALGAVPEPVPSTVTRMLASLRQVVEQAPPMTAELEIVVEEVHAKRLSIQALRAELDALDHQLEVLERTLGPVQAWGRQWDRVQHALTESLHLPE